MKKNNYFWIKKDKEHTTIGLIKEAFETFLPLEGIELPKEGKKIKKGEVLCIIESSKAALELESPVSGKVVKVHDKFMQKKKISWDKENSWICVVENP